MLSGRWRLHHGPVPRRFVHACVAIAAAAVPSAALAAKPPDWARSVVEAAPAEPEAESAFPEKILLLETKDEVQRDGTVRGRQRYATQILSGGTRGLELGWFHFDEATTQMKAHRAWHVPPGKGAKRSRQAPVDVVVGSEFLTNSKARVVPVADVEKGSIVLFEFETLETPRFLPRSVAFGASVPIGVERYVLEVPEGWKVEWDWLRGGGPEPLVSGSLYTWERAEAPPLRDEPMAPPLPERQSRLAVNVIPPASVEIAPAVFETWGDFSSWYEDLLGRRHEADSSVRDAATEALPGGAGGAESAVGGAGRYVRDKVRYVAVELGIGAMQPRKATETLANLYGDCKDKGTLFRSLLSTRGVDSYPILVNSSFDGMISEAIPAWGFNHFIVAVPLPEGPPVPAAFAPAILDAQDLGRLLVVDTTDEHTSIGSISASLAGKKALLVAGDRGRLVTLPGRSPSAHRIERRLAGELSATGHLGLLETASFSGEFARRARYAHSLSSEGRRRDVERHVLERWPEATIERFDATRENEDGTCVETVGFRLKIRPQAGGSRRLEIFPGAGSEIGRVSLGRREAAVVYDHPFAIRYEVTHQGLPEGVESPEPREESGEGWKVRSTYELHDGGKLNASWELVLEKTRFEPAEFEELRRLWNAVSRSASAALKLPGE